MMMIMMMIVSDWVNILKMIGPKGTHSDDYDDVDDDDDLRLDILTQASQDDNGGQ